MNFYTFFAIIVSFLGLLYTRHKTFDTKYEPSDNCTTGMIISPYSSYCRSILNCEQIYLPESCIELQSLKLCPHDQSNPQQNNYSSINSFLRTKDAFSSKYHDVLLRIDVAEDTSNEEARLFLSFLKNAADSLKHRYETYMNISGKNINCQNQVDFLVNAILFNFFDIDVKKIDLNKFSDAYAKYPHYIKIIDCKIHLTFLKRINFTESGKSLGNRRGIRCNKKREKTKQNVDQDVIFSNTW